MVQLRSWMIPAEACPGTFVTLKGACGKTTTTIWIVQGVWFFSSDSSWDIEKILNIAKFRKKFWDSIWIVQGLCFFSRILFG